MGTKYFPGLVEQRNGSMPTYKLNYTLLIKYGPVVSDNSVTDTHYHQLGLCDNEKIYISINLITKTHLVMISDIILIMDIAL